MDWSQSVHYPSLSSESLMSAFTRYALKFNISVLFLSLFLFISGCGTDGNTVIQPSSQEPTAEGRGCLRKGDRGDDRRAGLIRLHS